MDADDVAAKTVSKAASVSWPFPLDRRLDQLVELANEAGANTRRNELVAALVSAAEADGEALLHLVIGYRKLRVREVVLDVEDAAQVVELPRYPPGRRRSG
ncbi:hypothetical protein AB0M80_08980 [Amycolatopsis sp. NPDC051045]|uniref:hypothetical protein n=1 Tax=Amycolatopsis sp. NPDC051045 TaxID=3156922 RepID=UPI003449E15E